MSTRCARTVSLALVGVLAGAALAGCGAGTAGPGPVTTAAGSPSPGALPSGYPSDAASALPTGTALTAPGSKLALGARATVAWQPSQQRVGVVAVTVTSVRRTTFADSFKGWQVDEQTKADAPFFVSATVTNAGTSDLGGVPVPLYGSATSGALVEATRFASPFKPCGPGVLPTPFPAGASADVCLVYLVPGGAGLDGVTFRPTQEFDPITWTGPITSLEPSASPSVSPSRSASPSPSPSRSTSASASRS